MKMCNTVPTFILLFTGYCVKHVRVAAMEPGSEPPTPPLPVSHSTQHFQQSTTHSGSAASSTAVSNTSLLVAGLSISFVLFSICVIIGIWNARKLSKQDSFDLTSAPSGEA